MRQKTMNKLRIFLKQYKSNKKSVIDFDSALLYNFSIFSERETNNAQ